LELKKRAPTREGEIKGGEFRIMVGYLDVKTPL
jgi:hypothetical protein